MIRIPVPATVALALAVLVPLAASSRALAASPAGLWKNIDEETRQAKALVRIVEAAGTFTGRIEKVLTDRPDARCDKCTDDRRDQPVQGMQIIRGMRKSEDRDNLWEGGTILDPGNGKVYRSQMRVIDGGKRLEVRGFVGTPLLGRSQTWIREE